MRFTKLGLAHCKLFCRPPRCPAPRRFQICVDVFAFGSTYMDLPSLGALPKYTGGQLYYYPGFAAERDGGKLRAELRCEGGDGGGWAELHAASDDCRCGPCSLFPLQVPFPTH